MPVDRCARCNESVKNRHPIRVNGVFLGPHCYRRYRERCALRARGGSGSELIMCSVCGQELLSQNLYRNLCGGVCCIHCPHFPKKDGKEFCLLEQNLGCIGT